MQCVTPMFYYYKIGDKKHGKVVPRHEVLHSINFDPNYIRASLEKKNVLETDHRYIQIPCQHCWACQLKYSAEWATRIMLEAQKYENNYFVTLTYNDTYLPIAERTEWDQYDKNPEDPFGEKIKTHQIRENDGTWQGTLHWEDTERFLNSLRKHFRDKAKKENMTYSGLKYFYCGEYGSETQRPHYHLILLNCPLNPAEFYSPKVDGKNFKAHWHSHELENLWATGESNSKDRKPLGIIDVAELEWSCAAYVARYCTKKLDNTQDKREYLENGKMPEDIRMSKGIGLDYFNEHWEEIYKTDELIMKTVKGNTGSVKPPKAYDRMLEKINPELYQKIKKSREKATERATELIRSVTDATDKQMLLMKAQNIADKMSLLPRQGEW